MRKIIFIIFYLFIICSPVGDLRSETITKPQQAQLFIKANEEYQKQNYEAARLKYEELLKTGLSNGHLYYNLGNCYTKLNKNGKAMLYYLKAKDLMPRDADLNSNINFLTKKTIDKLENTEDSQIFNRIFFWYDELSLEEHLILFLFFWTLLFFLLLSRRFINYDLIRLGIFTFSFLSFILGISLVVKLSDEIQEKAVVISNEANVKSSTDINSITMFKVHEGTVLKVTEKTDKWSKIELTKDMRGWIQDNSIENL